jgi:hypothetical protein
MPILFRERNDSWIIKDNNLAILEILGLFIDGALEFKRLQGKSCNIPIKGIPPTLSSSLALPCLINRLNSYHLRAELKNSVNMFLYYELSDHQLINGSNLTIINIHALEFIFKFLHNQIKMIILLFFLKPS